MSRDRPPLLLRISVVIGGAALLFGLIGLILLLVEDEDAPAWGPGLRARVEVLGAPEDAEVAVEVRWRESDVNITLPALRLRDSNTFLLADDVLDRRVEVHAWTAGDAPPMAARREVLVRRGEAIVLILQPAGPADGR